MAKLPDIKITLNGMDITPFKNKTGYIIMDKHTCNYIGFIDDIVALQHNDIIKQVVSIEGVEVYICEPDEVNAFIDDIKNEKLREIIKKWSFTNPIIGEYIS